MKKNLTRLNKAGRRRKLLLLIPGVLLLLLVGGVIYVQSLLGLVKEPDETGDPTMAEEDIFNEDDYVVDETTATTALRVTRAPGETAPPTSTPLPTPTETPVKQQDEEMTSALKSLSMASDKQVYNLLLIGTDRRPGEYNGRADTIMVLSVNRRTKQIHLVSLMRALYVTIPGHQSSMINAAFSWGGAKLLMQTIEQNFRIPIHDYVLIDFNGFIRAIDAVGGIPINLTPAEVEYLLTKRPDAAIQPGVNHLDGDLTLWYARIRKIDSDFTRTSRQRVVIETLIRQLGQRSLGELDGIARQILPYIKSNRSGSSLLALMGDAYSWRKYPISQLMIPIRNSYSTIIVRRAQMIRFDVTKNVQKLQDFLYG